MNGRDETIVAFLAAGPAWTGDIARACGLPFFRMETVRSSLDRLVRAGRLERAPAAGFGNRVYYQLAKGEG